MPKNYEARDAKVKKRRFGMRVSNRGIFLVQTIIGRRAQEAKAAKEKRQGPPIPPRNREVS